MNTKQIAAVSVLTGFLLVAGDITKPAKAGFFDMGFASEFAWLRPSEIAYGVNNTTLILSGTASGTKNKLKMTCGLASKNGDIVHNHLLDEWSLTAPNGEIIWSNFSGSEYNEIHITKFDQSSKAKSYSDWVNKTTFHYQINSGEKYQPIKGQMDNNWLPVNSELTERRVYDVNIDEMQRFCTEILGSPYAWEVKAADLPEKDSREVKARESINRKINEALMNQYSPKTSI